MNEDELRRVLDAEASQVEVSRDALSVIRQRIATRRARWLPRGGAMFAISTGSVAALATAAVAVFAGVGSCAPLFDRPAPPGASTDAPSVDPSCVESNTCPTTGSSASPVDAKVYVYYLGVDGNRPKLYRETHTIPAGDGSPAAKTKAAITQMFDGRTASDPDYASAWPASASVRSVRIDGDVVVVDLSGVGQNPVGSEYANQAVQQLIWSATATTDLEKVRILVDGSAVDELWGSVSIRGDLRRAPAIDVQALVWLISPQHGDTVGRTFDVDVAGAVFESTVSIRVRQGSTTVQETFITVSGPSRFGEGKTSLTLAPGTYTIEAYQSSPVDGSVEHLDDHQITVG